MLEAPAVASPRPIPALPCSGQGQISTLWWDMTEKGSSALEKETLTFWKDALPLELVRANRSRLPNETKIPERNAGDQELLEFYSNLAPKRVVDVIQCASRLKYPVMDLNDLRSQLRGRRRDLNQAETDVISSLRATDFPLLSAQLTIPRSFIYAVMVSRKGCYDDYMDCLEDAGEDENKKRRCEAEHDGCNEELQTAEIVLLYYLIELLKPRRPVLWPPIGSNPPRPFPWPY